MERFGTGLARMLAVVALACGTVTAVHGSQDPVPADVGADSSEDPPITRDAVERRLAELENAPEDLEDRSLLIARYSEILRRIDAERSQSERARAFAEAIQKAPEETARARAELAAGRARGAPKLERPEDSTVEELQQQLLQLQVELANVRAQQGDLTRRMTEERQRPTVVPVALDEARDTLEEIEAELGTPAPAPDAPERERVERLLLLARQSARRAEIAMLEQELLSNAARVEMLEAQRDLASFKVALAEERVRRVEGWISELRQADAESALQEAERLRNEAIGKHPLIQEVVADIAASTHAIERLVPAVDRARASLRDVRARLERTTEDYQETQRSLDMGITRSLGTVLLEQRRQLPNARSYRRAAVERSALITEERLALFRVERQLKELSDEGRALDALMARDSARGLDDAGREALREELARLLATKRNVLSQLDGTRREFLGVLGELETREQQLLAQADQLAAILDERLLWIPNAPVVAWGSLERLRTDLAWLFSTERWSEVLAVLRSDLRRASPAYVLVALVTAVLLAGRRRLARRLEPIAARVDRVREDGIMLTVRALCVQILREIPLPLAAAFLGWRLMHAAESTEASKDVGWALVTSGTVGFVLQFLRALFRANGVGLTHFHWGQRAARLVRRNLLWFAAFAVPSSFLIVVTQEQSDALLSHSLGRFVFLTLMAASAVLAYRLLHGTKGLFVGGAVQGSSVWLRRTRPAWMPLGVLVPLALAGMAAAGYYYAALQLEARMNETLLIILGALFVHAFLHRWLLISQRRLSMKMALEKRAALLKSREREEGDAAVEGVLEAIEEIDVAEIKDQTQDLLRGSIGFLLVVGLWFAWVSVLPALSILDDVTLWHHTVVGESGAEEQHPITLARLCLALLLVVVTITAARNTPGFLEIAILQRLPLEPGVRYATRTLVLYAIVATGIVVAFNAIGVGWSSVQWLLAALTVGLGFGLQEIFANFVSGLIILLERPIRVGDTVTVGEVSGVVSRIRMRATTITDWKRRELVVPNKNFITGELINWSLSDPILRLEFVVGIAYGSDTTLAHRTMLDVCRAHPLVLDQPEPNVFFVGFGDNSLNFEVRIFVSEPTNNGRTRILHDLHMAIDQACRERSITIAFPQRDLHLKSAEVTLRVAVEDERARREEWHG